MSYWNSYLEKRLSRRTTLKITGAGVGLAALSLAGCGSGGGGEGKEAASGLVVKPVESTAKATKGGRMPAILTQDPTSFDGIGGNTGNSFRAALLSYSRLMKYTPGKYPATPDGSVEPDAASGWEQSPDGLTYTFKVRPNLKYDPRPPTNNRPMTSADVKFSWDRFAAINQGRTDLAASAKPDAPVASVTAPDASTVVFKLAYPYAPFLTMLPYYRYMSIMPVETESFNYKTDPRGTGPWRMTEYQQSVSVKYDKNPDWYDASKVYLDGIDQYVVPEYAAAMTQLRAGNVWTYDSISQEDVLQTKRDVPQLIMQNDEVFTRSISPYMTYSILPGSPFLDERVRFAVSMLIDRDLWIDTFFNVPTFKKEGLDVPTAWNSHLPAGAPQYWVDPQGKDIGAGGKNFQFNPAEAKKLLQATGMKLPLEMDFHWTPNGYGPIYTRQVQVNQGMLEQYGDFKFAVKQHDYATDWTPNFHQGNGKYTGMIMGTISTLPDLDGNLIANYHSGGIKTWWGNVDTQMDKLIDDQRRELDTKKRTELIKEFQRYAATKMYTIQAPGEAPGFKLAWPWFGNRGVYRFYDAGSQETEAYPYYWYDASKKTA